MGKNENLRNLLEQWCSKCSEHQSVHYITGNRLASIHSYLGISLIIISTIVGTSFFATLQDEANKDIFKITCGIISLTGAVLASLQTFLKLSERAELHRLAGVNYGKIRREMEQYILHFPDSKEDQVKIMDKLRTQMDILAEESPRPSMKAIDKVRSWKDE